MFLFTLLACGDKDGTPDTTDTAVEEECHPNLPYDEACYTWQFDGCGEDGDDTWLARVGDGATDANGDFTLIETTGIDAEVGDEVEIFGPNLPLEEVAANFNTNPRQLLCCLGPRVERKYVNIRQRVGALEKSRAP